MAWRPRPPGSKSTSTQARVPQEPGRPRHLHPQQRPDRGAGQETTLARAASRQRTPGANRKSWARGRYRRPTERRAAGWMAGSRSAP